MPAARELRMPCDGLVEAAGDAAELVVGLAAAVERHADVAQADLGVLLGLLGRDLRAVRGDDDAHALALGVLHELDEVLAERRLAAGEQQHRRAPGGQVVDHRLGFFGGHLAGVVAVLGLRVAVHALEVALLRAVPHHDGLLVLRELEQLARQLGPVAVVAQDVAGLDGAAVELRDTYHRRRGPFLSSRRRHGALVLCPSPPLAGRAVMLAARPPRGRGSCTPPPRRRPSGRGRGPCPT